MSDQHPRSTLLIMVAEKTIPNRICRGCVDSGRTIARQDGRARLVLVLAFIPPLERKQRSSRRNGERTKKGRMRSKRSREWEDRTNRGRKKEDYEEDGRG